MLGRFGRSPACVQWDHLPNNVDQGWSESVMTRQPRPSRVHQFYLAADLASHDLERWRWYDRYRYPIVQHQRLLRHVEFLDRRRGRFLLVRFAQVWRLKQLGMKLDFTRRAPRVRPGTMSRALREHRGQPKGEGGPKCSGALLRQYRGSRREGAQNWGQRLPRPRREGLRVISRSGSEWSSARMPS